MAIEIKHRFYNRLTPNPGDFKFINTVIIGTFNPGLPDRQQLNEIEKIKFETIELSDKFKEFNKVKNFYDRPQNRFWGVLDRLSNTEFYDKNGIDARNHKGLKFYKGMDREVVFKRQKEFCICAGIFITDVVKEIFPQSFDSIYDNFPDTTIEISNPVFHTDKIFEIINHYNPKRVLINFRTNSAIPKISEQINKIKQKYSTITTSVLSTSGAATNKYTELLPNWRQHIFI